MLMYYMMESQFPFNDRLRKGLIFGIPVLYVGISFPFHFLWLIRGFFLMFDFWLLFKAYFCSYLFNWK